jgi:hypothetical protein
MFKRKINTKTKIGASGFDSLHILEPWQRVTKHHVTASFTENPFDYKIIPNKIISSFWDIQLLKL